VYYFDTSAVPITKRKITGAKIVAALSYKGEISLFEKECVSECEHKKEAKL
jgi:hypothetical protein